jgi:hypothetical protein
MPTLIFTEWPESREEWHRGNSYQPVLGKRHLAAGLADMAQGRTHGPYSSVAEGIAALERRTEGGTKMQESGSESSVYRKI